MTTLVIDRATLPDHISSLFCAPRIVIHQRQDGGEATFSPVIDPNDYDSDAEYLAAIPGFMESVMESVNSPKSEFSRVPEEWFDA